MPKKAQPFSGGTAQVPSIHREKTRANGRADVLLHCGMPMTNMENGQWRGDCPFCGKENHFYIQATDGLWDCKKCSRTGNIRTFVREFYEDVCVVDENRLKALGELRGLNPEVLKSEIEVRWNPIAHEYVIPTRNSEGSVSNLLHYRNHDGRRQLTGLPTFSRGILGYDRLFHICNGHHPTIKKDDPEIRIWIGEGPWDKAALRQALMASYKEEGIQDKHILLFATGSGGIPDDCIQLLNGRKVRIVNDNDDPGRQQTKRIAHRIAVERVAPSELLYLQWPDGLKDGYDLNDLVREKGNVPAMKLMAGKSSCMKKLKPEVSTDEVPGYDPNVNPIKCESFQELMNVMRNSLEMFTPFSQSWLFSVATAFTLNMGGVPIWAWLTGPAGSGKTTLAEIVAGVYSMTFRADKFTGFFSGFSKGGKDHSLIQRCNKRVLIIPDFTGMLSNSADTSRVFGELRNISEGKSNATYRNDVKAEYSDLYFPMLACVTNVIRTVSEADMGERFLICEIDREWIGNKTTVHDNSSRQMEAVGRSMIEQIIERPLEVGSKYIEQKCHLWGFLNFLRSYWTAEKRADAVSEAGWHTDPFIAKAATIVAVSRSIVSRKRDGSLEYRPRAEVPTRIYAQLLKSAIAMYLVLRPSYTDKEAKAIVKQVIYKIAMDTAFGWPLEIMLTIGRGSMTVKNLQEAIGMSHTSTHRYVNDLIDLGVLEKSKLESDARRGPKELAYTLQDSYKSCMSIVLGGISETPPSL